MARYSATVRDQNQRPIQGARVIVTRSDGSAVTLTDDDGNIITPPFITDEYGGFYFNGPTTFYDIVYYYGGRLIQRDRGIDVGGAINSAAAEIEIFLEEAEAFAVISETAAGDSEAAAGRAEMAAEVAQAGVIYDTVGEGLAATAEGRAFSVYGAPGSETFSDSYRKVAGVASPRGSLPSKVAYDGISPYINSKILSFRRYSGATPNNPAVNNAAALTAAIAQAGSEGKFLEIGNDDFYVTGGWTAQNLTAAFNLRGEGGRLIGPGGFTTRFANLRAPIDLDGVNFEGWADLFVVDQNVDLTGRNLTMRNIHARECFSLLLNTQEAFNVDDILIEYFSNVAAIPVSGIGRGQGLRYQAPGFRSLFVRNGIISGKSFQGVRLGGFPHDLRKNEFISIEHVKVTDVLSTGQSNGVQIFGSNFYANHVYVRNVDCPNGSSSNVEPFYCVGTYGEIGNIDIETGGNAQGALAIKAGDVRNFGPIRINDKLHPRMAAAVRIDGGNVELNGLEIEWNWQPVALTTGSGTAYAATYLHADTAYSAALPFFFQVHTVNTGTAPTLDVNGLGPKTLVRESDDGVIELGQLRPDAVYRATYNSGVDRLRVRIVNWVENVPIITPVGNQISLPAETLTDGKVYWFTPATSLSNGPTLSVGGGMALPINTDVGGVLTPSLGALFGNGFPKAVYYSAANNCFINMSAGGAGDKIGRFVAQPDSSADAYTYTLPYPGDQSDALFVIWPASNAGTSVTWNGAPVLKANGAAMTAGYLIGRTIYAMTFVSGSWRASQIGRSFFGIDTFSGAPGRQVLRNIRFTNTQYFTGIASVSSGDVLVDGVYVGGRSAFSNVFLSVATSASGYPGATATIRNMAAQYFYGDGPAAWMTFTSGGFVNTEVTDVGPPRLRGTLGSSSGVIIAGSAVAGVAGAIRARNVRKHPNNTGIFSNAGGFTSIDGDHVTEVAAYNPNSVPANSTGNLGGTRTHTGAKVGDMVRITHSLNDTGLMLGGYVTADNTVQPTGTNPTGSAIDLGSGTLAIQTIRLTS